MGEYAKKIMAANPETSRHPYTPVPKSQFAYLEKIPVALYLKIGSEFVKFIDKHESNREELYKTLFDRKINKVYVHLSDRKILFRETERNLHRIVNDNSIPFEDKAHALNSAALSLVEDIFEDPDCSERVRDTKPLIENQITLLQSHPQAFLFMSNLGAHDYYTYTHSIGVSTYALAYFLAQQSYDPVEVAEAGQAALLHDVGKAKIPWDIINKKGDLTENEWQKMKQHPEIGHAILKSAGIESEIILQATRNHHENLDGSGYPDGLVENQLHDITQVVGFSDVFSALTTNRSYSPARSAFEAFTFMKEKLDSKFSQHIFKNFLVMFKEESY